ncbi:MAG TPA: ADP-ribosylglycohydrolase family protein, partial [Candidatus Baltobacteraceae bacterium]|nr:ADP-ribosylglycohydrolase family protein [Candidatus Baltobacteraceae bacterium]
MSDEKQRAINVMLGVHLGDALGVPFEMMTRQEILNATGGEGVTRPRFDFDPSARKLPDTRGLTPGSTSD